MAAGKTPPHREPRSRLDLDVLISEAARTLRAMQALCAPRHDEAGEEAAHPPLPDFSLTNDALRITLSARLDALSDLASFEPAQTPRQALAQLMLAIPCLEIVRCDAFGREVSREDQHALEKLVDKATRLVYSAVAALFSDADPDLLRLRQHVCDPADDPINVTDHILSLV